MSILAEHQDVQEKFYQDVQQCKIKVGKVISSECLYVNAVLEGVFRFKPITENVMHGTVCDNNVAGHFIPAGTMVQANFTSIHFNTNYFEHPESFNSDRCLSEGIFKVKYDSLIFLNKFKLRKVKTLYRFHLEIGIVLASELLGWN